MVIASLFRCLGSSRQGTTAGPPRWSAALVLLTSDASRPPWLTSVSSSQTRLLKPADTDLWYTFESLLAASHAGFSPAYPTKFSPVLRPPAGQATTNSQADSLQVCNYPLQWYCIYLLDLQFLRISRTMLSLGELTSRTTVCLTGGKRWEGVESFETS